MGKGLPKKGNTLPSGYDIVIDSLATAIGMLLTGKGDVKDSNSLAGKSAEGKPETKNKGILGLLSKISNNTDIIVGGEDKSLFTEYLKTSKANAEYLRDNVFKDNDFVNTVKKIPDILTDTINKSLTTVVDKLQKNGEGEQSGNA